jgi:hypothetical protein
VTEFVGVLAHKDLGETSRSTLVSDASDATATVTTIFLGGEHKISSSTESCVKCEITGSVGSYINGVGTISSSGNHGWSCSRVVTGSSIERSDEEGSLSNGVHISGRGDKWSDSLSGSSTSSNKIGSS